MNIKSLLIAAFVAIPVLLTGCDTVKPGQIGVLIENYGKDVNKDYSITTGRVFTALPSTSLYLLPTNEQRSIIETPIKVKSSNNSDLEIVPRYSYRINPAKATLVIRQHAKFIGAAGDLKEVEKQALDPAITDVVRSIIEKTSSEALMAVGGNKNFNDEARKRIAEEFDRRGLELLSFSAVLELPQAVKDSINAKNTANSKTDTIDSQILQAKKQLELTEIEAKNTIVNGEAITEQQLRMAWIAKWDGKLPDTVVTDNPQAMLNIPSSK